jgi:hypothetical protein
LLGKTAPVGWPKSDCTASKPQKYGASVAAQSEYRRPRADIFRFAITRYA